MEPDLSHADLVSGAVFVRVGGDDPAAAELVTASRGDPFDTGYKAGLVQYAWDRHRSLIAHEWAHVLQVASYPYLFLRAARQGREMSGVSVFLEKNPGEWPLPLPVRMVDEWRDSRLLSQVPVRVRVLDREVAFEPVTTMGAIVRGALTESDLIEEDAQIFQYRVEIGSRGNGAAYRRWLRERPRYSLVYNLLTRYLGVEPAYRLLPLLVRLAFATTRPLEAFFRSFGMVYGNGLHELSSGWDSLDVVHQILERNLAERLGPVAADSLTMFRSELADPPGVIDERLMAQLLDRGRQLPVSVLTQAHLDGGPDERGAITRILAEPWEYFPRRRPPVDALATFLPPGFVFRPAGAAWGASVISVSPLLSNTPFPPIAGADYGQWFVEVLRARRVWKAIHAGAAGANPGCAQDSCRFHGTGLCHGWFPFPKAVDDCAFPQFFTLTTKHDVAPDGTRLEPVPARRESEA